MTLIVALAGRRIDAAGIETPRFPWNHVPMVQEKLKAYFMQKRPVTLVCSGACGADLLALEVAGELGIERRMVLPFSHPLFKEKSVVDCKGNWGELFDRIHQQIEREGGVVVLHLSPDDKEVYEKTNSAILNMAQSLLPSSLPDKNANQAKAVALIVWDGKRKRLNDMTAHFAKEAKDRNMNVEEIDTLE